MFWGKNGFITKKMLNECFNQVFNASKVGNKTLQTGALQCFRLSDEWVKEITHTILRWNAAKDTKNFYKHCTRSTSHLRRKAIRPLTDLRPHHVKTTTLSKCAHKAGFFTGRKSFLWIRTNQIHFCGKVCPLKNDADLFPDYQFDYNSLSCLSY